VVYARQRTPATAIPFLVCQTGHNCNILSSLQYNSLSATNTAGLSLPVGHQRNGAAKEVHMSDQTDEAAHKPVIVHLNVTMEGAYTAPALTRGPRLPVHYDECSCQCGSKNGAGAGAGGGEDLRR
jgi:hypothetical protein